MRYRASPNSARRPQFSRISGKAAAGFAAGNQTTSAMRSPSASLRRDTTGRAALASVALSAAVSVCNGAVIKSAASTSTADTIAVSGSALLSDSTVPDLLTYSHRTTLTMTTRS